RADGWRREAARRAGGAESQVGTVTRSNRPSRTVPPSCGSSVLGSGLDLGAELRTLQRTVGDPCPDEPEEEREDLLSRVLEPRLRVDVPPGIETEPDFRIRLRHPPGIEKDLACDHAEERETGCDHPAGPVDAARAVPVGPGYERPQLDGGGCEHGPGQRS